MEVVILVIFSPYLSRFPNKMKHGRLHRIVANLYEIIIRVHEAKKRKREKVKNNRQKDKVG